MLKTALGASRRRLAGQRYAHSDAAASSLTTSAPTRSIAVVGAGIAGLTLTLHLARHLLPGQRHRIVLYDADQRVGGWVRSDRVPVKAVPATASASKAASPASPATTALVEAGPRSIRPVGLPGYVMLHLIKSLGLSESLLCVPKSHASAKNRFLYYAGKIHLLPSSLGTALRTICFDRKHPLSKGKIPSTVLRAMFKRKKKGGVQGDRWADESIESFLQRSMGAGPNKAIPVLDYVGSAVLHGIYAADASKLSVRSIFGFLWNADLVHGNPSRAALPTFLNRQHTSLQTLADVQGDENARLELIKAQRVERETEEAKRLLGEQYVKEMESVSVVSFPNGIQALTDAMIKECQDRGVSIQTGSRADSITLSSGGAGVEVKTENGTETFDRVVSALPSASFEKVLRGATLPNLAYNASSTVAVLNLAIPASSAIKIPAGFGYLVPRACAREGDNPLGLLGVVFDSVAVPGQDECTKLTMMSGGPFWQPGYTVYDLLSRGEEAEFIDQALFLLAKHLSIDESLLTSAGTLKRLTLQRDCIVTYAPGHLGRMDQLDVALQRHRALTLIGASYTGVSLNDCVLYATRTAKRIVASEEGHGGHESVTGLEELVRE